MTHKEHTGVQVAEKDTLIPSQNPYQYNGEPLVTRQVLPEGKLLGKQVYIESYGCQMNFSDSEIVASILKEEGFEVGTQIENADLVLLNTCSIREKAEQTIRKRITEINRLKQRRPELLVGILGCMAERLKHKLLEEEKVVDLVVGPDAYRSLPILVRQAKDGHRALNVLLSREETYGDISPVRLDSNGVSAFVSIMRGCNNMCSFCVVPFTRGRERSRSAVSIVEECRDLSARGYKEVTLLGQNVDSYCYQSEDNTSSVNFAQLLAMVAEVSPMMRIRFSTSHPKDITDEVLYTMSAYPNICKYIHLPVQSGSTRMLEKMNRKYTREWYLERVKRIKEIMPECAISTDIIAGFCGETEQDHQDTLSLMEICKYEYAYMFMYSERPGTPAAKQMEDDVPAAVKKRRLAEIVELQRKHSLENMEMRVGKEQEILIEGSSKRGEHQWMGRNTQNQVAVFDLPKNRTIEKGTYSIVRVTSCTSATLFAELI